MSLQSTFNNINIAPKLDFIFDSYNQYIAKHS
jgi:hypothetical protein